MSHGKLVYDQTMRRVRGEADDTKILRRTFVYENRPKDDPGRATNEYPPKAAHVDSVRERLENAGLGAGTTPLILWGYPKHFDLPDVIEATNPNLVVIDVVDDHRTWRDDHVERDEISEHYAELIARADITLTNCAPMHAEMSELGSNVHLVPNGCQWPAPVPSDHPPAELVVLDGPIIGYVGNLSSRIDIDLLDAIATKRSDWNLVLIGSTHANRDALELDSHDNVHFLGPRSAAEARHFIEHFDVAIIPHLDDPMTRKMHPLKAFVYCSAGIPVVSTAIDNLGELAELITVAQSREEFIDSIETALTQPKRALSDHASTLLAEHSWATRMTDIETILDDAWRKQ